MMSLNFTMTSPCERSCGMYEIMGNDFVHATRSSDTETIQGIPIKRLLILEHCGQSRIACSPLDE